jgi:hypothetical protein
MNFPVEGQHPVEAFCFTSDADISYNGITYAME